MDSHGSNDDIITLSSSATFTTTDITTETTLKSSIPELQLCINDLVNPTETAETLLETLSNEQLNIIEQAVHKIKERKLFLLNNYYEQQQQQQQEVDISTLLLLSTVTTATPNSPMDQTSTSSSTIMKEEVLETNSSCTAETISIAQQMQAATANMVSSPENTLATMATTVIKKEEEEQKCLSQPEVTPTTTTVKPNSNKCTISTTAKPPANSTSNTNTTTSPFLSTHEPITEIREGVEWVSFVYSHHRTLRRYCIRTDLDKVDTNILDEKFKKENCVYPRANLPRETYRGNRWAYETECNVLGWKLAYLNLEEIAGKRGLIQRAVDSYRNRYPSMRSRRVARQEKLLKGTLRKRKNRENENPIAEGQPSSKSVKCNDQQQQQPVMSLEKAPKTLLIQDTHHSKCRIKINIESVVLDAIDLAFRKNNCVFPRSMHITAETPHVTQRRLDEAKCNEIGWKLAWLNPRQLANKKNLLQKALDIWRNQFTLDLKPRKYASRTPPNFHVPPTPASAPSPVQQHQQQEVSIKQEVEVQDVEMIEIKQEDKTIPLTEEALEQQQKEFDNTKKNRRDSNQSFYSGTTVTLDFHDYCFSPPVEEEEEMVINEQVTTPFIDDTNSNNTMFDELMLAAAIPPLNIDDVLSESTSSSSGNDTSQQNTPSPAENLYNFYQHALLLNSAAAMAAVATAATTSYNGAIAKEVRDGEMMDTLNSNENNNTTVNLATSTLVEFMNKYQCVIAAANAGMGGGNNNSSNNNNNSTTTTSSIADSNLLSQLF